MALPQISARILAAIGPPTDSGMVEATSSMPSLAVCVSSDSATVPAGAHPDIGGKMPAQGARSVGGTATRKATFPSMSGLLIRARRSRTALMPTTESISAGSASAQVLSPTTVGPESIKFPEYSGETYAAKTCPNARRRTDPSGSSLLARCRNDCRSATDSWSSSKKSLFIPCLN